MTTHEATAPTLPPQIACGSLPDPSGLLAGVIGSPDDDAPRLVYADWLDEQAQERGEAVPTVRAELIRIQCGEQRERDEWNRSLDAGHGTRLTPLVTFAPEPDALVALARREKAALTRLLAPMHAGIDHYFRRGFLKSVRCPWEKWHDFGDSLRSREWVPRVVLTTRPDWGDFAARPSRGEWGGQPGPTVWHYQVAGRPVPEPPRDDRPGGTAEEYRRRQDERLKDLLAARWPGTTFEFSVGWHVAGLSGTGGRVTAGGRTVAGVTAWSMNPVTPAAEELLADSATSLPLDLSSYTHVEGQIVGGVAQALGVPPEVATGTSGGATTYASAAAALAAFAGTTPDNGHGGYVDVSDAEGGFLVPAELAPAALELLHAPLPADGWHAEFHTDRLPTVDAATGAPTGYRDGLRSLLLTLDTTDPHPEAIVGARLPLVRATDAAGRVWECAAVLESVTSVAGSGRQFRAASAGELRCVEGP